MITSTFSSIGRSCASSPEECFDKSMSCVNYITSLTLAIIVGLGVGGIIPASITGWGSALSGVSVAAFLLKGAIPNADGSSSRTEKVVIALISLTIFPSIVLGFLTGAGVVSVDVLSTAWLCFFVAMNILCAYQCTRHEEY